VDDSKVESELRQLKLDTKRLREELDATKRGQIDAKKRRIVNASASQDQNDVVIRAELYQFLKDPPRFPSSGMSVEQAGMWVWGRAKLGGVQSVATDVLAHPYVVRLPAGYKLMFEHSFVSCKVKPTTSTYVVDFLVSTDDAATFTSIYPAGNANKLNIAVSARSGTQDTVATSQFLTNTYFRVDILAADGVVSGIEMIIRWKMEKI